MLKHLFIIAVLGSVVTVHAETEKPPVVSSSKPNILFIFADYSGIACVACGLGFVLFASQSSRFPPSHPIDLFCSHGL